MIKCIGGCLDGKLVDWEYPVMQIPIRNECVYEDDKVTFLMGQDSYQREIFYYKKEKYYFYICKGDDGTFKKNIKRALKEFECLNWINKFEKEKK